MAYTIGKTLPNEYFKLEYIESTGTQYIDTGWKPADINFRIEIGYAITGTAADQTIFGADEASLSLNLMVGTGLFQVGTSGWSNVTHEFCKLNSYADVSLSSKSGEQILEVNAQKLLTTDKTSAASEHTIGLFTNHKGSASANTYYTSGKIYYFRCYENDNIVRYLIPCMNRSCTLGFYDLVNDVFYTNSGAGTFRTNIAKNSRLPNGITELEYIRTTGSQYINTGYIYKQLPTAEIDYATDTHANSEIFGWGMKEGYSFLANNDAADAYDHQLDFWDGAAWNTSTTNIPNSTRSRNRIMFAKNNSAFEILQNGLMLGSITNSNDFSANTYPARIFSAREGLQHTGRLYGAKLWDNGVLVRNFIPCKLPDGTIGVYDLVEFKFYGNAGSGTFIEGPALTGLPDDYTRVDYIQSTGTQYINTGITGNASDKFELRMSVAYSITSPANQIMGFNGHAGNGIGTAGATWWEAGALPQIKHNQIIDVAWYEQGSTWVRTVNGLSASGGYASSSITTNANLNLFATHESSGNTTITYWCYCKMFAAQVLINNNVVRNFIPCINPDGVAGLYDSIENKFYVNSGSGEFRLPTNSILPIGYIPVEYIESFGNQWINSEANVEANTWVETDLMFSSAFGYNMMFGQWSNFALSLRAENSICMGVGGSETQDLGSPTISGMKYNYVMGPGPGLIQNGVQFDIGGSANREVAYPIILFGAAGGGTTTSPYAWSSYGKGKIYTFKIYKGTTADVEGSKVIREFIPCLAPSGEPGLYDLVAQKFYYNRGSGSFGHGAPVGTVPTGYTKLTTVESTGVEYIDTEVTATRPINITSRIRTKTGVSSCDDVVIGSTHYDEGYCSPIYVYQGAWHFDGITAGSAADNTVYNVHARNTNSISTLRVNGSDVINTSNYSSNGNNSRTLWIFANNYGYFQQANSASIILYDMHIASGGILCRSFIPCVSSSGEAGLYDYVTGIFFTNKGSGSLAKGATLASKGRHRTLINGTGYSIISGRTLLDGTIREILHGKTRINGTVFTIPISYSKLDIIEITLNQNGGSGGTSKVYYHYGKHEFYSDADCLNPIDTITTPTRSNYTFTGYIGDGSCGGTNGESYITGGGEFAPDLCYDIYKSTTLTATWTAAQYTISFDSNGGSACSAKSVAYNSAIGTLPTPTRDGYWFVGWYNGTASRDSSINYKDRPWIYYADAYGDLYNAFGYNDLNLANHYWDAGSREGRRISQYEASDTYTVSGSITLYAGWAPVYAVSQTTENWSDWSGLKDYAWEDYEAYRAMSINGGGDIAATTRTDTAVYGQRLYVMAKNKYSERWSNIIVNNVDQGEYQTAEYSMPISAPTAVVWVFDTRNWIFDNPQAFWDCYIWY